MLDPSRWARVLEVVRDRVQLFQRGTRLAEITGLRARTDEQLQRAKAIDPAFLRHAPQDSLRELRGFLMLTAVECDGRATQHPETGTCLLEQLFGIVPIALPSAQLGEDFEYAWDVRGPRARVCLGARMGRPPSAADCLRCPRRLPHGLTRAATGASWDPGFLAMIERALERLA